MLKQCLIFASLIMAFFVSSFAHAADKEQIHFLSLADIHFDPFIACHTAKVSPCPLVQKLRAAPASAWPQIFAENDHTDAQYRQDSNITLLRSALAAAHDAADKEHVHFAIILGDFLGHDFRHYYKKYARDKSAAGTQEFIHKTMAFITNEIAHSFSGIDVYAVIGNNDSYRGDYQSNPGGQFLRDATTMWSALIKTPANRAAMQSEFPRAGYYAVTIPGQPSLRFIFLNTVLFSYKAKGRDIDRAADVELEWLHRELQMVKAKHQKAYIAMHIPPGIDVYATLKIRLFTLVQLWEAKYAARFQKEVQEHAADIYAIFSGHLHSDWFQVLTFPGLEYEVPITGTPSISPLFGNNPGFKIYTYSAQNLHLLDFVTYYVPLNKHKVWGMEYDFNQVFQPACQNCIAVQGMKLLQPHGVLADQYKKYYAVDTNAQPITTHWDPYYWCAIYEVTASAYKRCINT